MANLIVNNGKQRFGCQAFRATAGAGPTYNVNRHVQTMSVDDSAIGLAAGHTALDSGGAVTNMFDAAFDATPTRSGQSITMVMTIPQGSGNFPGRRFCEHDDTPANVTVSSSTLIGGADGQSLTKTADFTETVTKVYTFS